MDNFQLVAKAWLRKDLWGTLIAVIDMGEEEAEEKCLGGKYANFTCPASDAANIRKQHSSYHRRRRLTNEDCSGDLPDGGVEPNRLEKGKTNDMQDFVDQCADTFCILGHVPKENLRKARTPLTSASKDPQDWVSMVDKDCDKEDDSPHRRKELGRLVEEIKDNKSKAGEKNKELQHVANPMQHLKNKPCGSGL